MMESVGEGMSELSEIEILRAASMVIDKEAMRYVLEKRAETPYLPIGIKMITDKIQSEEHMKKLYPTSEKHFIRVVYEHFMRLLDNPTMEDKEKIARVALDLHKQYFHCCLRDIEVADKD